MFRIIRMSQVVKTIAVVVLVFLVFASVYRAPTWLLNIITSKYVFVLAMLVAYKINVHVTVAVAFTFMILYCSNPTSIEQFDTLDQSTQSTQSTHHDEEMDSITASMEQSIVDKLWFPENNE